MECRDAIKLIKDHVDTLYAYSDICEASDYDIILALKNVAIPAMEKEIERDVAVKTSVAHWNRTYYACPNEDCDEFIRWKYDVHFCDNYRDLDYRPGRCPFCGQSLKWR